MEDRRIITQNWPTGLVGTIGVMLVGNDGVTIAARSTVGITESPAGSGRYVKTVNVDPAKYPIEHIWDDAGSPTPVYSSGLISNELTKAKIREGLAGRWTNESAETINVTITDIP